MTKTDHEDWHTGEHDDPQIMPIAPSKRGKPQSQQTMSRTTTDDGAGDQGQSDDQLR